MLSSHHLSPWLPSTSNQQQINVSPLYSMTMHITFLNPTSNKSWKPCKKENTNNSVTNCISLWKRREGEEHLQNLRPFTSKDTQWNEVHCQKAESWDRRVPLACRDLICKAAVTGVNPYPGPQNDRSHTYLQTAAARTSRNKVREGLFSQMSSC